jgi:MFS family permease
MNVSAIAARESFTSLALPLVAVFVVSMGFGLVLPVLPFVLALALGEATPRATISWHTGLLTGTYMLALFLFAPFWGYVSDRVGRRTVILIGLAGFIGAMLWFALARGLVSIYAARAFAGVFAAAVLPVVFAWVSDVRSPPTLAGAFAWLSAASALGFLFGPTPLPAPRRWHCLSTRLRPSGAGFGSRFICGFLKASYDARRMLRSCRIGRRCWDCCRCRCL